MKSVDEHMKKFTLDSIWFLILPLIGLIDSFYLMNIHYNPGICVEQGTFLGYPLDCGYIAQSSYSEIITIPVAMLGIFYYLTLLIVINFRHTDFIRKFGAETITMLIVGLGMAFTIYLVILQLAVLHAICVYCMISALTTTTLFILTVLMYRSQ